MAAEGKHVISCVVENRSGVLAQVASMFSARGFNIDSLAVGRTEDPTLSRMTIVVVGDDAILEQVRKQLGRLISVIKVIELSGTDYVERDLMLIKVTAPKSKRPEILQLVEIFHGKTVDVSAKDLTIEISGNEPKLEAMISLLEPYGIREMVRTGRVAIKRG